MKTQQPIIIGQAILQELRKQGRPAAWLAEQLKCNRTNVYKIFSRSSIDCELLLRISNALSHNFFDYYSSQIEPKS